MLKLKSYLLYVYHSPRQMIIHLCFILGLVSLTVESNQESVLFQNIVRVARIQTKGQHDTVFVKQIMVLINKMMHDRSDIFMGSEELSFKAKLIHSVDADLMYGAGACGGFSKVLARSLKTAGYTTRIGQMLVDGEYGGHILLEAYLPSLQKWVVLDPSFLLVYTNPQGVWASFEEVHQNWEYYKKQIPNNINYKYNYKYEGIRYTNWSKVPVLGNLSYQTLKLIRGEEFANTYSLRPVLLDSYRMYKWIMGFCYYVFILISYHRISRKKSE